MEAEEDLYNAIEENSLPRVQELVDSHGVGISLTMLGHQSLHFAAWQGRLEIVQWLVLQAGASVHARTDFGQTPLHCAADASRNRREVMTFLATHGAFMLASDANGETPLDWLRKHNDPGVAALEAWYSQVEGWTALQICAYERDYEAAAWLLERGLGHPDRLPSGTPLASEIAATEYPHVPLAAPVCPHTLKLMRLAEQPWSPRSHRLFGPVLRTNVVRAFMLAQRLVDLAEEDAANNREASVAADPGGKPVPATLPPLPAELWIHICSFLPRSLDY